MPRELFVFLAAAAVMAFAYALIRVSAVFAGEPGEAKPFGRGRFLADEAEMRELAQRYAEQTGDPVAAWLGNAPFTAESFCNGLSIIGATGSGKGITYKMLLTQAISHLGGARRIVVHDPKAGEYYAFLRELGLTKHVVHLNPFSAEDTYSWDIARDLNASRAAIPGVVESLIPLDPGEKQPHFARAARTIVSNLIRIMLERLGKEFDLGDLFVACQDRDNLAKILLGGDAASAAVAKKHVSPNFGETSSVLSTLSTATSRFQDCLGAWRDNYLARRLFSVTEWEDDAADRPILVIGQSQEHAAASKPVSGALLSFLLDHELSRSAQRGEVRAWYLLDELPLLGGSVSALRRAQDAGRSAGVALVLGTQSVESLVDQFGSTQAVDAILGGSENFALFRQESPKTREWCQRLIGSHEIRETDVSVSTSSQPGKPDSTQVTERQTERSRTTVLSSEFATLPKPGPRAPLVGYYLSRLGCWTAATPPEFFPPDVRGTPRYVDGTTISKPVGWSNPDIPVRLGLTAQTAQTTETTPREFLRG